MHRIFFRFIFLLFILNPGKTFSQDIFTRYRFSVSYESKVDSTVYVFRPGFTYYTKGNHALFAGISIPVSTINQDIYNQWGFRLGGMYIFPKHRNMRIEQFFEFEFSHMKYNYQTTGYDTAYPNIPIPANLEHLRKYSDATICYGGRLRFAKRFFFSAMIGFRLFWKKEVDEGSYNYYSYNKYHDKSDSPNSMGMGFTGALNLGYYFSKQSE